MSVLGTSELASWRMAVGPKPLEEMRNTIYSTDFENEAEVLDLRKKVASWIAGGWVPSKMARPLNDALDKAHEAAIEHRTVRKREAAKRRAQERAEAVRAQKEADAAAATEAATQANDGPPMDPEDFYTTSEDFEDARKAAAAAGLTSAKPAKKTL